MNERILELAKQAGLKKEHGTDREYIGDFDWREFTKLIVEECVNLMENQREHYYSKVLGQQSAEHYDRVISKGDAFDEAANIIKKHFRS